MHNEKMSENKRQITKRWAKEIDSMLSEKENKK
jgi:hypothetical protein